MVQERKDELERLEALMEAANTSSDGTTPISTPSAPSVDRMPPEMLENREAESEEQDALKRTATKDDVKKATKEATVASDRPDCSSQATRLPTPPPSTDETVPKVSQGRKRRRGFDADEGQEMERPTKIRTTNSNTSNTITNEPGLKAQRRRETAAEF